MTDSEREPAYTARQRFLELLCSNVSALFMMLIVCVVLSAISVVSFFYLEPGTPSYVVLQIDIALLVLFVGVLSALVFRCHRYRA